MRNFLTNWAIVLIGVAIFLVGCIQPSKYEAAKENGYEVDATVVEVKSRYKDDMDGGPGYTAHTVYADYEVDGKEYKHVKIGTFYDSDSYYKGKIVKVVVNPDNPGKPMFEGGVVCVIGFLIMIGGIVAKFKKKKAA